MRGLSLFLHALWIAFATAKFTQPVSSNEDFYQLWTVGDTIDIRWDAGWNWGSGDQPKLADLFITWYDSPTKFTQLLLANVSLAQSGNYTWKVNVPNERIAQEPKFVFRFGQHTDPEVLNYDLPQMPSRGFILRQKEVASSTSSTSATVTTSSSTSSAEASKTSGVKLEESSSPSPSATNNAVEGKSSGAVIAAGILGGLLAVALVLGGVLFFLWRAKKRREEGGNPGRLMAEEDYKSGQSYGGYSAHELPIPPTELGDHRGQSRELNGSTPRDWH